MHFTCVPDVLHAHHMHCLRTVCTALPPGPGVLPLTVAAPPVAPLPPRLPLTLSPEGPRGGGSGNCSVRRERAATSSAVAAASRCAGRGGGRMGTGVMCAKAAVPRAAESVWGGRVRGGDQVAYTRCNIRCYGIYTRYTIYPPSVAVAPPPLPTHLMQCWLGGQSCRRRRCRQHSPAPRVRA